MSDGVNDAGAGGVNDDMKDIVDGVGASAGGASVTGSVDAVGAPSGAGLRARPKGPGLASAIPSRADHSEIKRNNLEVVLRHLSLAGPDSRAAIAARAGLTRATVSRLVAELVALGLVRETGTERTRRVGRPGTRLELDGRHVLALGAEINVDYIAVIGLDLAGREVHSTRLPFDAVAAGPGRSVTELARLCGRAAKLLARRGAGRPLVVAGLAVAVPGLVDAADGVVTHAPNLHWTGIPVGGRLRELLALGDAPVIVGNDANLGAIAEYRVGAHAGTGNLVYVTGEVGIGGGVIAGGRLLLGSRGYGGEIGHMRVDPDGPRCGCGRHGCWEARIGLSALLNTMGAAPAPERTSGEKTPESKVAAVVAQARAGDARTLAALDDLGRWVGVGAANLANIFNPQAIILGGYFGQIAEWILAPARQALSEGVLAPGAGGCELTTSVLGFTAAARGGALHVIDQVVSNPPRLAGAPPQ
jgi:predicted NBD/HSP70 family sugar kinase